MSEEQANEAQSTDSQQQSDHPTQNVEGGVYNQSAAFSIPNTNMAQENASISLEDIIPSDYKEKPYMQKIKNVGDLFKSFDNAQKLIGQKNSISIPGDDATDEEKSEFRKALGVPESSEKYEVKLPEGLKEDMVDSKQMEAIKSLAHELGLNNKQLQSLVDFDLARQQEVVEYNEKLNKELDEEFDKISKDLFGERHDKVMQNAKELMGKYTPGLLQEHVKNLDNNSLFVLAGILDNIHRDYISEDKPVGKGAVAPAEDPEELRQQAWEIMKSKAHTDPSDPGHAAAVEKVTNLYNRRERLLNGR